MHPPPPHTHTCNWPIIASPRQGETRARRKGLGKASQVQLMDQSTLLAL